MTFDILLSPPDVGHVEEEFLLNALRSGWIAPAGPDLNAFENELAARVGVGQAVALSSGTAALHLALVAWGVRPGDIVIVPTFTFAATANAVMYVGATPHFVDCDAESGNISAELLGEALSGLAEQGRRVPVVIAVDMLGKVADYEAIEKVCAPYGVRLLSDAAESLGAHRHGRAAGSFGDAAALSFNGNKVMTTSGGGMFLTEDEDLAAHVRKLSTQAREPVVHYEHAEVGYNYRLSNLLAALGRGQLARLDEMIERRRNWRAAYADVVARLPGLSVFGGSGAEDNCWLTSILVDPAAACLSAQELSGVFAEHGIETRPLWKPMHMQPVFRGCRSTLDGSAQHLFEVGLTLPSGSGMTQPQLERVCAVLDGATGSS